MKIQRLTFTPDQFNGIPEIERSIIVVLAHALNEVNSLNKLLFLCSNIEPEPAWKAHAQSAQAFVLARCLAGKLNEAWNVIQKGYFGSKLSKTYSSQLETSATEALGKLKAYFSQKNFIFAVRNDFGFHYSLEHGQAAVPASADADELTLYLHQADGNSLYHFAEYVMNKALAESISPNDPQSALGNLLSEMSGLIGQLNEFVQGLLFVVLDEHIGENELRKSVQQIEVGAVPDSSEIIIPYFIEIKPKRADG